MAPNIDFSVDKTKFDQHTGKLGKKLISWHRFKSIKELLPFAFYDRAAEAKGDPWYPISGFVDQFNKTRKLLIASGSVVTLDELMSPFQPRTTKTSLLPVLSWIFRKPKPLGTEYKNAADTLTQVTLFLEIQRGKQAMKQLPFFGEVGSTAACTLRLIVGATHCGNANGNRRRVNDEIEPRQLVVADSWFGSVRVAESLKLLRRLKPDEDASESCGGYVLDRSAGENPNGHELVAAVKTNTGWFPKKELEEKMRKWPSGSYLVLTTTAPESNIKLVALGYKYNAKKVLCFVCTANAGSTVPGAKHYIAKFPDRFGNTCSRKIPRPQVLSSYFANSNLIDSNNHARQHLLGLERLWHTTNPWFRNVTTIVGTTAIDCWRAIQYHCPHMQKMTVEEFADRLAFDCINNPFEAAGLSTTRGNLVADA